MRSSALVIAAVLLTFGASTAGAIVPLGDPIALNTSPRCFQDRPEIAALAGGGFVAVWVNDEGVRSGLVARLLDADGRPVGDEMPLDERSSFRPVYVAVAADDDGGFVIAWWEVALVPLEPPSAVFVRAFDGEGRPRSAAVEVASIAPSLPPPGGIDLAIDGEGRRVVAWSDDAGVWLRRFEPDLAPIGEAILVADRLAGGLGDNGFGRVALAVGSLPVSLVVWEGRIPWDIGPPPYPGTRVRARLVANDGGPQGEPFTVPDGVVSSLDSFTPAAAALGDGAFAVAWGGRSLSSFDAGVFVRLLDPFSGIPLGDPVSVVDRRLGDARMPALVAAPQGGFVAAWQEEGLAPPVDPLPAEVIPYSRVYARRFAADATPAGVELAVAEPGEPDRHQTAPAAAIDRDRLVVVWREHSPTRPPGIPPCAPRPLIFARTFAVTCATGDTRLCLQGGRFAVEVRLPDPRSFAPLDPRAHAAPLTDDAGSFWFFRPANVELLVKVLDGRPVNGHFWVFAGALSNVNYAIDVTDFLTGERRTYENPQGRLTSLADTRAFADPPSLLTPPPPSTTGALGGRPPAAASFRLEPVPAPGDRTHPIPSCDAAHVLCLHDGRFQAQLTWRDPRSGASGAGTAANLSDESGTFWFFRPSNVELVMKVLDGRPVNGFFWVFFGGLTDVEFTFQVEDTLQHTFWSFHNPPYALTSHADTTALPGSIP